MIRDIDVYQDRIQNLLYMCPWRLSIDTWLHSKHLMDQQLIVGLWNVKKKRNEVNNNKLMWVWLVDYTDLGIDWIWELRSCISYQLSLDVLAAELRQMLIGNGDGWVYDIFIHGNDVSLTHWWQ